MFNNLTFALVLPKYLKCTFFITTIHSTIKMFKELYIIIKDCLLILFYWWLETLTLIIKILLQVWTSLVYNSC